jgi:NADPH-dependent glutamate synthase beta subunit-like oxidoreductase
VDFTDEEREFIAADRRKKRLLGLMDTIATTTAASEGKGSAVGTNLVFLRSPSAIVASAESPGVVGSVDLEVNALEGDIDARRARGTGTIESLPCGAVFRSIGYKAVAVDPDVPFDDRRGVVPNSQGRVDGAAGLYCAGWVKTGPTGVIATTMANAYETARSITADLTSASLGAEPANSGASTVEFFADLDVPVVTFAGWKAIEAVELRDGAQKGKVSEKVTDINAMVSAAAASAGGVL